MGGVREVRKLRVVSIFLTSLVVRIGDIASVCRPCFAFILRSGGIQWYVNFALSDFSSMHFLQTQSLVFFFHTKCTITYLISKLFLGNTAHRNKHEGIWYPLYRQQLLCCRWLPCCIFRNLFPFARFCRFGLFSFHLYFCLAFRWQHLRTVVVVGWPPSRMLFVGKNYKQIEPGMQVLCSKCNLQKRCSKAYTEPF